MTKLLLPFVLACSALYAAKPIEPPVAPAEIARPASLERKTSVHEYQGDEIGLVLRTLARQMKINLVVREEIRGHVTLRVEDKTMREVFDIIVSANGYKSYTKNGVTYVVLKNQEQLDAQKAIAREKKALLDAYIAEGFSREEAMRLLLKDGK